MTRLFSMFCWGWLAVLAWLLLSGEWRAAWGQSPAHELLSATDDDPWRYTALGWERVQDWPGAAWRDPTTAWPETVAAPAVLPTPLPHPLWLAMAQTALSVAALLVLPRGPAEPAPKRRRGVVVRCPRRDIVCWPLVW